MIFSKISRILAVFLVLFLVNFFVPNVRAQFDENPFEGCGSINPNRNVPREELCLGPNVTGYIYPHVFCATNANVCCPANAVTPACSGEDDYEEEEEDDDSSSGYETSNQTCGSWTYDAGIGQNLCFDNDRRVIEGAETCGSNPSRCCRAGNCPQCWQLSAEGASCQPCQDGESGMQYTNEDDCLVAIFTGQDLDINNEEFSVCTTNLRASGQAYQKCLECAGPTGLDGIWTSVGCIPKSPQGLIQKVMNIGIGILGGIFLLRVLAAGFTLTVSQGDVKRTAEAKEMITESVIGVLFVLFSVTILQFIGSGVLKIPGFGS